MPLILSWGKHVIRCCCSHLQNWINRFEHVVFMCGENSCVIEANGGQRAVSGCVGQCIEGSLNHPSLTIRLSVPQRCPSPCGVSSHWTGGGDGERQSAVILSVWSETCPLVTDSWNAQKAKDVRSDFIVKALCVLARCGDKFWQQYWAIGCCFIGNKQ